MPESGTGPLGLRALVRLEIQRTVPILRNSLGMGAVVVLVLVATGAFTRPRLAFALAVLSGGVQFTLIMSALRDKLDGGLEFLRVLPVSPRALALARLLAAVALALPLAVAGTAAAALALADGRPELLAFRPLVSIYAILVPLYAVMSFGGTAVVLRFDTSQAGYAPLYFLGAVLLFDHLENRYFPDAGEVVLGLMSRPWFPPVAWLGGVAIAVAVCWVSFALAWRGIARFTPPRDRMTW